MEQRSRATLAFPALLTGAAALAAGPWLVRLADVAPVASAMWRMAIAAPILLIALTVTRAPAARSGRVGWALAAAGVLFAADIASWHLGIARTTLANATLFGNTSSFLFAGWGFWLVRSWPGRRFVGAMLLALAGLGLLIGQSLVLSAEQVEGDLLCVLAALFYTGYLIIVDRVRGGTSALFVLAVATAAGAVAMVPLALAFGGPIWPGDWAPVVALAIGSQVVGQGLVVWAMGHLKPEVSGLGLLIQPVIAGAIGWVEFGEVLGAAEFVGATMVLGALVVVRTGKTVEAGSSVKR